MKPRIRAFSIEHFRWHYNTADYNINYYRSDDYEFHRLTQAHLLAWYLALNK